MAGALVLLVDIGDAAVLGAAQAGLRRFGTELCLQPAAGAGAALAPPPAAPRPCLGLCNLAQPPGAPKPVLQVRCRPGPFNLRDFYAAVGRLQAADRGGVSGATAASALQQVAGLLAADASCAAAGPRRSVVYLTDRTDYDPDDFRPTLEVVRGKGVHIELLLMAAPADGSSDADATAAAEALAGAWGAAEAAFPHLSVAIVQGASRLSFDALASTLLQRWAAPRQLAVSLVFKAPLVGGIRALQLAAAPEVRPLAQCVRHAALCPCHRAPAAWAGAAALCAVTGSALDPRQCGRDERTVQVGAQPGGALHLAAPFNIASAGGGSGASLSVVARVKASQANPALLFGVPLLLGAAAPSQHVKVVHDGDLVDCSQEQLLGLTGISCPLLNDCSAAGEALLATCTTDLETGAAGLFRLHYLLLPCAPQQGRPPALCAKRLACAEELLAPLLGAGAPGAGEAAPPPPAVAEAVAAQLARVPLEEELDPLALSSRCVDTIEMLVRESQPLPKLAAPAAVPAAPPAAVPPAPAPAAAAEAVPPPAPAPAPAAAPPPAPAAPAGRGRRGGGSGHAEGGQRGGRGGGKGALEFRRSTRR